MLKIWMLNSVCMYAHRRNIFCLEYYGPYEFGVHTVLLSDKRCFMDRQWKKEGYLMPSLRLACYGGVDSGGWAGCVLIHISYSSCSLGIDDLNTIWKEFLSNTLPELIIRYAPDLLKITRFILHVFTVTVRQV